MYIYICLHNPFAYIPPRSFDRGSVDPILAPALENDGRALDPAGQEMARQNVLVMSTEPWISASMTSWLLGTLNCDGTPT